LLYTFYYGVEVGGSSQVVTFTDLEKHLFTCVQNKVYVQI